jgi:hypothetical protein
VKDIKSAILKRRYAAAKQVNKVLLKLYYSVGGYVSAHSRDGYPAVARHCPSKVVSAAALCQCRGGD